MEVSKKIVIGDPVAGAAVLGEAPPLDEELALVVGGLAALLLELQAATDNEHAATSAARP